MTTFDQRADMQRLIESLARMDIPTNDGDTPYERTVEDAAALYAVIEQARVILKARARQ